MAMHSPAPTCSPGSSKHHDGLDSAQEGCAGGEGVCVCVIMCARVWEHTVMYMSTMCDNMCSCV